jgi:flagellar motor switch/type III secretory pathway protein FliN
VRWPRPNRRRRLPVSHRREGTAGNDINMILDIPVQLTVELGPGFASHILQLAQGSVVELETQPASQ